MLEQEIQRLINRSHVITFDGLSVWRRLDGTFQTFRGGESFKIDSEYIQQGRKNGVVIVLYDRNGQILRQFLKWGKFDEMAEKRRMKGRETK